MHGRLMNSLEHLPRRWGWCVLILMAGCGPNPQAQFSWRESTLDLLPKGRDAVQAEVNNAFGTPHDFVAWERWPVEFGGIRGTVTAAPEGAKLETNQVVVDAGGKIEPDSELLWVTGKLSAGAVQKELADKGKAPKDPAKLLAEAEKAAKFKITAVSEDGKVLTLNKASDAAAGDAFVVGFGQQLQLGRTVYMKNCNHCHGVAGDGNGPTAQYLNPRPRDYRLGLFKFTSTLASEKAARDDLHRIIAYGIPGTYMPSFLLLGEKETAAVVEYIRWLAMRGEMEKRLGDALATDYSQAGLKESAEKAKKAYDDAKAAKEKPETPKSLAQLKKAASEALQVYLVGTEEQIKEKQPSDFRQEVDETADFIALLWKRGDDPASLIVPTKPRVADDAASRERGRLLYLSDKTKCYTCHGAKGRGNGPAVDDFWKKPGTNDMYAKRGLHDTWGNPLPPRDLTRGQYRGGRRPIDLFRRIYAGIKGTPMPAFGGTVLKDDNEIWDVVNFVMSLPYEEQLPSSKPAEAPHMAATAAVSE